MTADKNDNKTIKLKFGIYFTLTLLEAAYFHYAKQQGGGADLPTSRNDLKLYFFLKNIIFPWQPVGKELSYKISGHLLQNWWIYGHLKF